MGLVDTLNNVVPISPSHADYAPAPTQTQTQTRPNDNYQPSPNPNPSAGYSYPNNGYSPYGSFATGRNVNGSGIQKNGDVNVGNRSQKSGGVDIGSIGGNLGNLRGQQVVGDVKLANIG
ncbi:hypothetical protein SOVF_143290 [Spinacia oleracea]|nr:hypothetical protein SOVF_143290 [Spinacia oleracea]